MKSLLVSLCNALALQLVLHLHIFLVYLALLRQDLQNLTVSYVSLSLEILNPGLSNRDVNIDLSVLSEEGSSLSLLSLKESLIVQTTLLLVLLPALIDNVLVQLGEVSLVLLLLFLHFLVDFVALAREVFLLLDGTVGLRIFLSDHIQHGV